MDVHEQRILSNFTHNFKRKLKEIRYPYTAVSQYSVLRTSMSP